MPSLSLKSILGSFSLSWNSSKFEPLALSSPDCSKRSLCSISGLSPSLVRSSLLPVCLTFSSNSRRPGFVILELPCEESAFRSLSRRPACSKISTSRGLASLAECILNNGDEWPLLSSSRLCLSEDSLTSASSKGRRRGGPGLINSLMMEPGFLSSTRRLNEMAWSLLSTGEIDVELGPRPGEIKLESFECGGVVNLAGPREGEVRLDTTSSPGCALTPSSIFIRNISSSLRRFRSDKVRGWWRGLRSYSELMWGATRSLGDLSGDFWSWWGESKWLLPKRRTLSSCKASSSLRVAGECFPICWRWDSINGGRFPGTCAMGFTTFGVWRAALSPRGSLSGGDCLSGWYAWHSGCRHWLLSHSRRSRDITADKWSWLCGPKACIAPWWPGISKIPECIPLGLLPWKGQFTSRLQGTPDFMLPCMWCPQLVAGYRPACGKGPPNIPGPGIAPLWVRRCGVNVLGE